MTTELKITGMTCNHCQHAVAEALRNVAGVSAAEVDLAEGTAVVRGDAQLAALTAAVADAGYEARPANG